MGFSIFAAMIHHIVVSREAAKNLEQAAEEQEALRGKVWVLEDSLSVGPLDRGEAEGFTIRRQQYWSLLKGQEVDPIPDMERIGELSARLYRHEEEEAWFWLSSSADDLAAYLWSLPYMVKHLGRYRILSFARLPFLNEAGTVFYPQHLGEISIPELVKARKLAIPLTEQEAAFDLEHAQQLRDEGAALRLSTGSKKLVSVGEDYFDPLILDALPPRFMRGSR